MGKFPLPYFHRFKISQDGYDRICKLCKVEGLRDFRRTKYGMKAIKEYPKIRHVGKQNKSILKHAAQYPLLTLRALNTTIKTEFNVTIQNNSNTGGNVFTISVYSVDGVLSESYSLYENDMEKIIAAVIPILKKSFLRLELTDADLIASKIEIYYL